MVVLDVETYDRLAAIKDADTVQLAVLLHELGHLVGLAHVDDRGEIMYADGVTRTTLRHRRPRRAWPSSAPATAADRR